MKNLLVATICVSMLVISGSIVAQTVGAKNESAGSSQNNEAKISAEKEFTEQLAKHLKAIQNRDVKAYSQTISKKSLIIMLKDGGIVKGYDDAVNLHRNWFGMKWKLKNTIEETEVYGDTARALVRMELAMYPPNVDPVLEDNYMTLIFYKESDGWKLVSDQCTPIVK